MTRTIQSSNQAQSKRICVIGAGSAGLAVLKYISQTSYFKTGSWSVIAYESRSKVGGIWYPAPPTDDPPLTPLYDSLITNIPHPVMAYTDYSFPPSTPLFPVAAEVQAYLESYASHFNLTPLIRFNVSVTHAAWIHGHWKVTVSTGETLGFDHLVVANGHYRVPYVPDIPGLDHWMTANKASHSAYYRHPRGFGRKVLVVGNGPSGKDISAEMRDHAQTVVRSFSRSDPQDDQDSRIRGRPLRFYQDGRVLFEPSVIEDNVDHCILATGFQMDFPFFDDDTIRIGEVLLHPALSSDLYNSGHHVFPLAKFLFPLQSRCPATSVAFMVLPLKVVPFPLAEAQARAAVRVFADPDSLDLKKEMDSALSRSHALVAAGFPPLKLLQAWFRFTGTEQWDYRDGLFAYAAESGDCPATKVSDWEKEIYANKDILRAAWVDLEKKGESQKWVDGIGEKGVQEWVEMMYRLLQHARERSSQAREEDEQVRAR